jgi:hypothetical protein
VERIGIAASRMAQGNLLKYNLFVIGISSVFSFLLFLLAGFVVIAALFLISLVTRWFAPQDMSTWANVGRVSLTAVAILISILDVLAIVKNIKITKNKL